MGLNAGNSNEVVISSRGKFISKAVDVAEVIIKRFFKDNDKKIFFVFI